MSTLAARRALGVLVALALSSAAGRAQDSYAPPPRSTLFDTSVRASAMGGASAAVMWGEPGIWGNPATLAGISGVGWMASHTLVSPSLSDQIVFASQRLLIGGGGIGVSLTGKPISGIGKALLDLGTISLTPFGDISSNDRTQGWGVGVSPLRMVETARKLTGSRAGSLTRYGDVWFGYQAKSSEEKINDTTFPEAETYDWGLAGRLALARWWGADAPFRLDLSGAYAQVNVLRANQDNPAASTAQIDRTGVALHVSHTPPAERSASPPSLPRWRPGDVPELSMGIAYDHQRRHVEPYDFGSSSTDQYELEASIFRLLSLRVGYLSDPDADIQGVTYGGGVTLPIGPWGRLGYELASVPLGADVDRQFRQGWSVWLDPARIFEDTR